MKSKWWLSVPVFYTELVLACLVLPLEMLRRAFFKDAVLLNTTAGANQFAGRTTLASGDAFSTISTAVVNSDSIIQATMQVNTNCGSGIGYLTVVSSIVSGKSFAYGYADGQGRAPGGTIMWEIRRTS
jgi:hypothetical protein